MSAKLFTIPATTAFSAGSVVAGAKANFYITGTTTRQNTYTDEALSVAHANPVVADANGVFPPIYLDDTLSYKVDITDSDDNSLSEYPVDDVAVDTALKTDLASTDNAKGASLVSIEDSASNFTATDVEAALAEIREDLASTANGKGASDIGIEDALAIITATTVEAALAELSKRAGQKITKTSTENKASDTTLADDAELTGFKLRAGKYYAVEGFLEYFQNVGNIQWDFAFTQAPQASGSMFTAVDISNVTAADFDTALTSAKQITTLTDSNAAAIMFKGWVHAHASTDGTMSLRWAQQTSSANNTQLTEGSWIRVSEE